MRTILAAALGSMLVAGSAAAAPPPTPCSKPTKILVGASSPCSGILMPAATALADAACTDSDLPTCRANLGACRDRAKLDLDLFGGKLKRLRAELATCRNLRPAKVIIEREIERPWWQNPALVFVAGAALGAGGFWAVDRLR